jgi:uncharacterized membrane protein YkvA (DUF1232 family)
LRRSLRAWARGVRAELGALAIAARRRDVPWHAKAVAIFVVAYALSPIDLIPDFIPVLGYLDDAILLPLGILLARRLVPAHVLEACREEAARRTLERRRSIGGALIVLALWALLMAAAWVAWRAVTD